MTDPTKFRLTYRRDGSDVVVEVHGEVDLVTAPQFRDGLMELIEEQGNLSVVVDLTHLSFIDSTGLTVLIQARKRLAAKHGRLVLRAVPPMAHRVLELTGLLAAFDVPAADDEADTPVVVDLHESTAVAVGTRGVRP